MERENFHKLIKDLKSENFDLKEENKNLQNMIDFFESVEKKDN